jgi:hypothetical protein
VTPAWVCLGGPLHGQWRAAGHPSIKVPRPSVPYLSPDGAAGRVALTDDYMTYLPIRVRFPGWRFGTTVYAPDYVVTGHKPLEVHPAASVWLARERETVCRWCFGRPIPTLDTCSRTTCITNVSWLHRIQVAVASDAEGWHGDA